MCIIAIKDYDVATPKKDIVANCFRTNPDGAGVAILRPGAKTVEISKGFMTLDGYFDFITCAVRPEDYAVYHFRITTSGGTRPELTHPFPVSDSVKDLTRLQMRSRFAFVHNGVFGPGTANLSDTQLYIKDKLFPLRYALHKKGVQRKIVTDTRGSRTVTIDAETGLIFKTGEWITDKDTGLVFSNSSFRRAKFHHLEWERWWDDETDSMYGQYSCPNCMSHATDIISFKHRLLECDDCDCLFDTSGKVWTYSK